jgi:hypothetical protein
MNCCAPTLLASGGTYANNVEMNVENILPFAFPFGIGGPKMKRRVQVSLELCIQVYMRLSLRQFMEGPTNFSYESYLQQANVFQKWSDDMQVKCRRRHNGRKVFYAINREF